jgi:hypothetical protein
MAELTAADLERYGYSRALWLFGEPLMYLHPDGDHVVTEDQALAEITGEADE